MDLGDLSGGELLDLVDGLARSQRQTEVQILLAARQHAVLNDAASIPGWQLKARGGERPRRFGGAGTPLVAEFSPASFAARLGVSTHAGRELMADALDLEHRLPRLWERVRALEVRVCFARLVARKTRDLTGEQADYVDERVAESADGRISWARFELLVEAAVKAAAPEAAAEREQAERRRQFAHPTASTQDGMRGFYIRGPFAVIARLDAAVAFFAAALAHLGDTSSEDERRVKAVLILGQPRHGVPLRWAFPLRGAWVTTAGRCPGRGPRGTGAARRPHNVPRVSTVGGRRLPQAPTALPGRRAAPVPGGHGRGAARRSRPKPRAAEDHRVKTFAGWQVHQPFPGIYLWRDPYGAHYLVDHTGTRRLTTDDDAADDEAA